MRLLFGAVLATWTLAAATSPDLSFRARREYGQPNTRDVAVADFNRDGIPDIAIAVSDGPVVVLFGNGDGTFRRGPSTLIGTGLNFVVAADFNGDGKPDVALATQGTSIVLVALGNGDGTFGVPLSIEVGQNGHLIADDFNGDGKIDLAVCTGNGVTILPGRGDGTFGTPSVTALPAHATNLAAGDLNGDGRRDLVVTTSCGISVLLGLGNGRFQSPARIDFEDGALAVAVTDLDGNGVPDIALVVGKYEPQVAVLMGQGNGEFSTPEYYDLPARSESIAVGDVNGDGIPDVVTANVCVFFGTGGGVMAAPRRYTAAYDPSRSVLADLRRDGQPDIVTADWAGGAVSILANRGDGTYIEGIAQRVPAGFGPMVVGDFNGDGLPDVAGVVDFQAVQVLLGTGNPVAPFRAGQLVSVPCASYQVVAADFNGDGKVDLAVPVPSTSLQEGRLAVLLGRGDGTVGPPSFYPLGSIFAGALAVGDFNGDGKLDIVNSGASILLGNGDGTFQAPLEIADDNSVALVAGDFDGDGKLDFVAVPATNSDEFVNLFPGNGDGTFRSPIQVPTGLVPSALIAGDFNGDGVPDLAVTTYLNGAAKPFQVSILLNQGNGVFRLSQFGSNPAGGVGNLVSADLNGDGIPDLAVGDGNRMMIDTYIGKGDGTFTFTGSFGTVPRMQWLVSVKNNLLATSGATAASFLLNQTR